MKRVIISLLLLGGFTALSTMEASAMTVSTSFPIAATEQPTVAIFTDTIGAPKFQTVYYRRGYYGRGYYRRGYYGRGYYGYRGYGRGWCYYHPYRC